MPMPSKGKRVAILVRLPEHVHRRLRASKTPDPTMNDRINRYILAGLEKEAR
jgi:hypothetical protein